MRLIALIAAAAAPLRSAARAASSRTLRFSLAAAAALAAPAFADDYPHEAQPGLIPPGGLFILYYNATGPLSYQMPRPRDLKGPLVPLGEVGGRSCQFRIAIPLIPPTAFTRGTSLTLAGGNGSYALALEDLRRRRPELAALADVRVDHHIVTVLLVFQRVCTEFWAMGYRR